MIRSKMVERFVNSGEVDELTTAIAESERELLDAAKRLEAATDTDNLGPIPTVEQRQEGLKGLIQALASGTFRDDWLDDIAPQLLDTTDGVAAYMEMDSSEWEAQVARWADSYRENGAEGSDRALADTHIQSKWGVNIETFEERIVTWDRGEEAERLFAGNFRAARDTMHEVAEQIEEETDG